MLAPVLDERRWVLTPSTLLTILRIIAVPFFYSAIKSEAWATAFWIFCGAGLTDALDGALARWLNQRTLLGACLDPLADKIMIGVSLWALASKGILPWWFCGGMIAKEGVLLLGAAYWALWKRTVAVKPSIWGKGAMVFQTLGIGLLLGLYALNWQPNPEVVLVGVVILALMMFFAFIDYGVKIVRENR